MDNPKLAHAPAEGIAVNERCPGEQDEAPPPRFFAKPPLPTRKAYSDVWKLAIPSIGENLLQTALLIVDTIMIAPFGPVPLAASSVAGVFLWRAQMTLGCIDRGATALVARYVGMQHFDKAAQAIAQSLLIAIVIGSVLSTAGILFSAKFFTWMGAGPNVTIAGTIYLQVILAVSIPRMLFSVAAASLRGLGDTRSPMWITLWMNVFNIICNIPLIYGVPPIPELGFDGFGGLGLTGSGISTALSITFACVAALWIFRRGSGNIHIQARHFRPHLPTIRNLLRIATPSFFEELMISAAFLVFFGFIAKLGTISLAAHSLATRVESLSFMAGFGFAVANATLVGQSIGARNLPLARQYFRASTYSSVLVMSLIAVVLMLFGQPIIYQFSAGNIEVAALATMLLFLVGVEQPLMAYCMTVGGGLRGAGDTFTPMIISIIGNVFVRVPASYVLAFPLGLGMTGIYLGTILDWVVRLGVTTYFYRTRRWERIRIT